eukprot:scaffold164685_cov30-Tisochrysis_lutea.AAC.3
MASVSGPGALVLFDALADGVVGENVECLILDAARIEDLHRRVGEATLRKELGALHEEEDLVPLDHRLDALLGDGLGHLHAETASPSTRRQPRAAARHRP